MNKTKIVIIISGFLGLIWLINSRKPKKIDFTKVVSREKSERYNGRIIARFIDKDQHYYHKIILNSNGYNDISNVIYLDSHIELYNFLKVGDSVIKKLGELKVRIIRENQNLDTIYSMKFNKYKNDL